MQTDVEIDWARYSEANMGVDEYIFISLTHTYPKQALSIYEYAENWCDSTCTKRQLHSYSPSPCGEGGSGLFSWSHESRSF